MGGTKCQGPVLVESDRDFHEIALVCATNESARKRQYKEKI